MSIDDSDIAFATDLFADIGSVTSRKMFGGICLYQDGTVFALMSSDGTLYLKTKDPEGLFGEKTNQFHNMPYYQLPDAALESPDEACDMANRALIVLR